MKLSECIERAHKKTSGEGKEFAKLLVINIRQEFNNANIDIDIQFLIEELVEMVKESKSWSAITNENKLILGLTTRLKAIGIITD